MSEQQLLPMTTNEWARVVTAADLLVGPGLGFNDAVTGEYDAAVHIATGDRLTEDARAELIEELRKSISETVHRVLGTRVVRTRYRTRQQEDPHNSELHHDYALGRDLPEVTS
ncbi:hypothetical protein ACFUGD_02805 [Streptomyces sp. NPDC057217]|uniref:hypothetical protein n=1 Tax=Streptomyces sp. NPDC057217 TaxID=3346054 RepID=UPI00363DF066